MLEQRHIQNTRFFEHLYVQIYTRLAVERRLACPAGGNVYKLEIAARSLCNPYRDFAAQRAGPERTERLY